MEESFIGHGPYGLYFCVFIYFIFRGKRKLQDVKFINERLYAGAKKIVSHCHGKVMQ
jgi:hypothetical protein